MATSASLAVATVNPGSVGVVQANVIEVANTAVLATSITCQFSTTALGSRYYGSEDSAVGTFIRDTGLEIHSGTQHS